MPTVAEQLRAAREEHGLTVHQVAEITKIKTEHVRALEDGNYDAFAAPVYIRGFARTYARLLHLDPEALVGEVDAELRQTGTFTEPSSSVHGRRGLLDLLMLQLSKVNWRVALPVMAVVAVLVASIFGYRAWASHRQRDPLSGLGPGQHQPAGVAPAETLPLPAPPKR